MVSRMYFDERADARRPGVLVFPEAFGLGDHAKSRAERLAGIGYVALACDLHGDGRLLHNLDEALALVEAAPGRSVAGSHARMAATLDIPQAGPRSVRQVAAIGYRGGSMAWSWRAVEPSSPAWSASSLATVAPQDLPEHQGQGARLHRRRRSSIPPDQRNAFEAEMREGRVDWQ